MKKIIKIAVISMTMIMVLSTVGCSELQSDSMRLFLRSGDLNTVRQITIINSIQGDILFQLTGKMSVEIDDAHNQFSILIEDNGERKECILKLADNFTYTIIDLEDADTSDYKYTLEYNPNMWVPVEFKDID